MHLDDVLTELVEHSGDRLLRVAYQLTHDAAAAQDLVQEALLRVYQSGRLRSSTEIVTDVVPERPAAGCPEDRTADQAELWVALGALSERQRAVLVLRYYEDLADHEIATLLGCREATVRSLASRGLAAMRPLVAAVSAEEEQT
jgi:DNA-directed RNA polymerase specialized sigma24 family protein